MPTNIKRLPGSPVHVGKTVTLVDESPSQAGVSEVLFGTDADTVLLSLFAESVGGTLDVVLYTRTEDGKEFPVITFPQLTAATSNLVIKKAAAIMSNLRLEVTYSGSCTYEVRARGTRAGETSVRILGANEAESYRVDVDDDTTYTIVPSSETDRVGVILRNWDGKGTLYIGYSPAETTVANAYPVLPGEAIAIDIAAGAELYGISDSNAIDVRVMEAGA